MKNFTGKKVINGTYGEMWLDGEYYANCVKLNAKIGVKKTAIPMAGQLSDDFKVTGIELKGSIKLQKVTSRLNKRIAKALKNGEVPEFTIISKLADPTAYGTERVALYGVQFDDVTLVDWERKKMGEETLNFTFTDYEYLEEIDE